jgi:hypothetical protein
VIVEKIQFSKGFHQQLAVAEELDTQTFLTLACLLVCLEVPVVAEATLLLVVLALLVKVTLGEVLVAEEQQAQVAEEQVPQAATLVATLQELAELELTRTVLGHLLHPQVHLGFLQVVVAVLAIHVLTAQAAQEVGVVLEVLAQPTQALAVEQTKTQQAAPVVLG